MAYKGSLRRTCYNCTSFDHQAKDCPTAGTPVCYNCSKEGHLSSDCTEPKQQKSCYNCGSVDHLLRECPDELKKAAEANELEGSENKDSSEQTSTDDSTEDAAGVPKGPKAPKTGRAFPRAKNDITKKRCFSCGALGHIGKNCQQGKTCFQCGELGHVSKDCSQQVPETVA